MGGFHQQGFYGVRILLNLYRAITWQLKELIMADIMCIAMLVTSFCVKVQLNL